jgi:hypothetical protein
MHYFFRSKQRQSREKETSVSNEIEGDEGTEQTEKDERRK